MQRTSPSISPIIDAVRTEEPRLLPLGMHDGQNDSNHLTEVVWLSERRMVVKRARYDWDPERFRAARIASRLLTRRTGLIAPQPLDVPEEVDGRAVEAYWRIELPTLREVWPSLTRRNREGAVRSWGALLRRVHKVRLSGYGRLGEALNGSTSLAAFLEKDLGRRLTPAIAAWWPSALDQASSLRTFIRSVEERVGQGQAALLHNDPHYGNVLCSMDSRPRCVGVLDLEAAMTGPPESDVAHAELLHGPLFGYPLANPWSEWLREGYGCALDPLVLLFYRAYHLLNLGWHAAFTGDVRHAADVELELREVVRQLSRF